MEGKRGNMLRDIVVTVEPCYGSMPQMGREYERKLTYCQRFHLLHSKHGTGNRKGNRVQGQCLHATESTALFHQQNHQQYQHCLPRLDKWLQCGTHSTCRAAQLKTSSSGKHVVEKVICNLSDSLVSWFRFFQSGDQKSRLLLLYDFSI